MSEFPGWAAPAAYVRIAEPARKTFAIPLNLPGIRADGGYSKLTTADERFCVPIPEFYSDEEAAPLLCAGLIGFRSLMKTGDARRIGIYGFGAAAHLVTQVAVYQTREIYAFTRAGDREGQGIRESVGAVWTGGSEELPPVMLTRHSLPIGNLVPQALRSVRKGGIVVCGGIHMSDIPQFPSRSALGGNANICFGGGI